MSDSEDRHVRQSCETLPSRPRKFTPYGHSAEAFREFGFSRQRDGQSRIKGKLVNQNSRRRMDKAHCVNAQSVLLPEPADLSQFDPSKLSALTAEELVDGLAREMELIERHERRRDAGAIALWNAIQLRRQRQDAQDSRDAA